MRFLCHTAHTPHLTIVTDFLSLQAHYSHPGILFSHLIEKKFSPHENTVPFMPFSLFSVRYAAQLRQRSFRTPLPTGIQGTKTHRQDPRMGPQPARARKRMRNGKRKIDRMEKTGGRECYSNRCGRLRAEKMGNRVTHSERIRRRGNTPTGGAPTGSRPYP